MKKIITLSLIFICFNAISQPVITSSYNPVYNDRYVYKIVDDTATAQPGQAGAGVIWNLTTMHGLLSTREYDWKPTSSTNDVGIFGANSNIACEIVQTGTGTSYEFYNVGANFTGDMKKVGSHVGIVYTNFGAGYLQYDYPLSYLQSCTDSMNGSTGVAYVNGRSTTTYDGYGTLQLEAQSGGNFPNVGRVKIVEDYFVNYGPIETHHTETYIWFDNTTANLKKQPIAIIYTHEYTDLNGTFIREKFALMRQILFQNVVPSSILTATNVSVSPNPFENKITFSLPGINSAIDISVCDITGRAVKNVHLEKSVAGRNEELDLSSLHNGVYLAKISSDKGTVVKRIVKD
ncbi:MAG: T9SS type A sorting domain-containing protein [Bacteroidota bacterium]